MPNRAQKISILVVFFLIAGSVAQACAPKPSILGSWNSGAPSNLQFDFRSNGSVWLVTQSESRQIWRYEFVEKDIVDLYDGLGRKQEYRFSVKEDTLTFFDVQTGKAVEQYARVKS